jgi:hypothetical protein
MAVVYFGANDNGNTNESRAANYLNGMKFTNTAGTGTLTEIGINCQTAATAHVRLGVYADSVPTGSPAGRLLDAGVITNPAVGWNTISGLSLAVTNNVVYWLAFVQDAAVRYYMNSGVNNRAYRTFTYAALPDPFGTPSTGYIVCMRAGVTLAPAGYTNELCMTFEQ